MTEETPLTPKLQLVAWELTRSCNLLCAHCRASAKCGPYEGELSTEKCLRIIDEILEVSNPILILSGGEPLLRRDIFQIAEYAVSKGLRVVMGTNGTLITEEIAAKSKAIPISRIGVSIDFPTPTLQDKFRGKEGAYTDAVKGIKNARKAGVEIQINSTITRMNAKYIGDLLSMALDLGAIAFHPFLLVPTGRGKGLEAEELEPAEYERILNWIYDKQVELGERIFFKPTDAPHYLRIVKQRGRQNGEVSKGHAGRPGHPAGLNHMNAVTRGCLAGVGFCFISHTGSVQGCGYLDIEAGNLKKESFSHIWDHSPLFCGLRDVSNIKGKCGSCEYKRICGGCRARAYEATGDCYSSEPYCIYEPLGLKRNK